MKKKLAPKKALGKTAKQGVVWSFLREGVTEILLFPASMVLARLLTPTEFGIAAAAGFFTLLAARVSELGFNAAIVRSKVVQPVHLSTVFAINLVVGGVTFGILTVSAPLVARFYDAPEIGRILPVAALGFLIAPFGAVPAALLTRNMLFRQTALVDWSQSVTFAMSTLVLAWLGFSYMSMVYGKLISVSVQTACRVAFARWRPSLAFSVNALGEIFPFGAGMHVKRLLDYMAQNVDNLVVGKFFGMAALGLYDKAFSTMNRFLVRMNSGGPNVTFRIFAIIHEQPDRFRSAYRKVLMSTTLVGFPVFAVLISTAPQLIFVLFGERWVGAAAPFQILCLAGCLKLLNAYASAATQAAGRIWSEVWRQVTYAALIVGSLISLRTWGPVGAAYGVLLATTTMTVLMHRLLMQITQLRLVEILRPQIPGVLCASGAASVVLLVDYAFAAGSPAPRPWLLLLCQALAAGAYYSVFVLFFPHRGLRALVREVAEDLAPPVLKQHAWVRRYLDASHESVPTPAC